MTKDAIINDIEKHLANSVKQYYSDFYVGITNDVNIRLFSEHNVDKDNDWWIYCKADQKAGYEAIRADDTVKTNDIVSDIIKKIVDSDMAICDMSSRNPNVFYELGLRHTFNLKTTLIKDKRTLRAFDIAGLRSVEYDENLRVDEVEKAIAALAGAITETEKMKPEESNSTLQLLGLSAPAKKVEIKAMSGENAAIMGEILSLRDDMDVLKRYHFRERSYLQQIIDSSSSYEDSSSRYDISDEM